MVERRAGLLGIKASTLILLLICSIYFVVYGRWCTSMV